MRKNAQLHLMLDSWELKRLKDEAKGKKVSLAELCRVKLRKNSQLDNIEKKIDKLLKRNKK